MHDAVSGREAELEELDAFFAAPPTQSGLVLIGKPGIGKSTLWEAGIAAAHRRGVTALSARPASAEARLSFAGLTDLLDGVDIDAVGRLPPPQRYALEVAILRSEPGETPPEPRAIALGFLGVLRALASERPLLVAIDDVQWLDDPSAEAIAFAARRLRPEAARFLLARRVGEASTLEKAIPPSGLLAVEIGPLSLGATRRMLSDRLGVTLPRRVLQTVVETAEGTPLFALELVRTLSERGLPGFGDDVPVPERLEDLLGTRVEQVPPPARTLLLAVALAGDLRASSLAAIVPDGTALDDAAKRGLVVVENERARASHPLLAAAAVARAAPRERRELHRTLASVVADRELRARHLALAAERPDDELAATVAAAAASAAARGARLDAVELGEHALRLTPPGSRDRPERLLALAHYLDNAGDLRGLADLLTPELPALPPGSLRARAWLLLAEGSHVQTVDDYRRHLRQALAEAANEPALHAVAVAKNSSAVIAVRRIPDAEAETFAVLPDARRAGPDVERLVLYALAWARGLRGRPVDDLCDRFHAASPTPSHLTESPDRVACQRLVWRGDLADARSFITRLLATADERGEAISYELHRLHLCELELRSGNWDAAEALLDEWAESADRYVLVPPMYERCRALLAVGRGSPDDAERWAAGAIERADAIGVDWDRLEALRARGTAALLAHEPERAGANLGAVWEHMAREGVDEPGVFPVVPDLVEVLVELGRIEEASRATARLADLAAQHQHPWGLVTARRCLCVVRLAHGHNRAAGEELQLAADAYAELGIRFEAARTLLVLGRMHRRHRRWAAARAALEAAASALDGMGSPGWAEEARSELSRVSSRRPAGPDELTPAERRVAALAADGLSNKEIARSLFISVHTVEIHLSHTYAKLGVHSRAQLPRALGAAGNAKV